MKNYNSNRSNYPQQDVNQYLAGEANCQFEGLIDDTMKFVTDAQLKNTALWKRFVQQYDFQDDGNDMGWRGEYWGKMMRGASFVYAYTHDEELYDILTQTVEDMLEQSDPDGRISTYSRETEFRGWDMWCRKYILLGMQYYLEICRDEKLASRLVECMCRQVDYIVTYVGSEADGKKPITHVSSLWRGLNSSSLLEPMVRLYNITKDKKYLDFAQYIVDEGGISVANIFQLAYENKFSPYQYPITKAYEMISCFEGLLEFYRVTKKDWYKTALVNFADQVLEHDFTIIGGCGCTHELFDHSTVRQANTNNGELMQETCVTVTLMKFLYQMTLLTGNVKYADAFERSFYNAYLGSINTENAIDTIIGKLYPKTVVEPLPFDSYSPLTAGKRGNGIGGLKVMSDLHYYGCCACIGSVGIGLVPKMALMKCESGIVFNMYLPGVVEIEGPTGSTVSLKVDTTYPQEGNVKIIVNTQAPQMFEMKLRNPEWSQTTEVRVNQAKYQAQKGYISIHREWSAGDEIEILFDMRVQAIYPIPYGNQILMTNMIGEYDYVVPFYDEEDKEAKNHVALRRGPLILAADSSLGYDAAAKFDIAVSPEGYVDAKMPKQEIALFPHMVEQEVPLNDQGTFHVIDYASAGKTWKEDNSIAAWIRTAMNSQYIMQGGTK